MKVLIKNSQKDLNVSLPALKKLVKFTLTNILKVDCNEVSVHLVTKKKISVLHDQFFGDPTITDCISFPIDSPDEKTGYTVLGEVFVCPFVAKEYANAHRADPYLEATLYIIHGLLHLIGYDDIESSDRKEMRKQERLVLKRLQENKISLA